MKSKIGTLEHHTLKEKQTKKIGIKRGVRKSIGDKLLDAMYDYLLRPIFAVILKLFYRTEVTGKENVPKDKGYIIAVNHHSYLDGPFIGTVLRGMYVHWVVSKAVYYQWYLRPIFSISRSVPVNGCTKLAEELLKNGEAVGIFPQGAICCSNRIAKGRHGVAVLAMKTGAPVIPCHIEADTDPNVKIQLVPKLFTGLRLKFGKPIYLKKSETETIPKDILNDAVDYIIREINGLYDLEQKKEVIYRVPIESKFDILKRKIWGGIMAVRNTIAWISLGSIYMLLSMILMFVCRADSTKELMRRNIENMLEKAD